MALCKKCGDEKEIINGDLRCRHCRWLYTQEYNENKERLKSINKSYNVRNKNNRRNWKLLQKYNLTLDEYDQILEHQNGVCAICSKKEIVLDINGEIRNLAVDHDHKTGKIRGLLCFSCNGGLERFCDDYQNIAAAIKYLEKWNK